MGIRTRTFLISLLLIVSVGGVFGIFSERRLRGDLERHIEEELTMTAKMASETIALSVSTLSMEEVDRVCDRLGRVTNARITVIDMSGKVLGDSSVDLAALPNLSNHMNRPEVKVATLGGTGLFRRYSETLHTDMLYVGVLLRGKQFLGVVRAAKPLAEVDQAIHKLSVVFLFGGLLALGLAVLASFLVSSFMARSMRELVVITRGLARGDINEPATGSFRTLSEDLRRTVDILASERDRFETVLRSMAEAVFAVDLERRIVMVNPAAMQLLNTDVSPVGQKFDDFFQGENIKQLFSDELESTELIEFEYQGSTLRQLMAHAAPLGHSGVRTIVVRDVTEMRRLAKVQRDFVTNVSHELRTPVSVIRATAETLRDGALNDQTRAPEFLDAMIRASERLSRLISDLLDLAKIESGKQNYQPSPVLLKEVADRVVATLTPFAESRQLTIQNDAVIEAKVLADQDAIEQVLLNLVDNAVKYTATPGKIRLWCEQVSDEKSGMLCRMNIWNSGPAIDPKHFNRIFERFYRIDKGRSRDVGGTGLGLSIVKHLVEAMGGTVGISAGEGGGPVFWFQLRCLAHD